jgi:hypothetical protein
VTAADKNGAVAFAFTVPGSIAAGTHTLVLTGRSSGLTTSTTFLVLPRDVATATSRPTASAGSSAAPSSSAPALADTGQSGQATRAELVVALMCLGLGGVALLLGRKRRMH